jgi:hypothetical protein
MQIQIFSNPLTAILAVGSGALLGCWSKCPSIASVCVGGSMQQSLILVEVIPSIIADVVGKSHVSTADVCGTMNDTIGCESIYDAIINAQHIGARLLGNVKPQNLLFVFGETVQSLQSALRKFADERLVAYPADDCYGAIYTEKDARKYEGEKEMWAIVLCKLNTSELLEPAFGTEKKKGCNDAERYEITWRELQNIQQDFGEICAHGAKQPNEKS